MSSPKITLSTRYSRNTNELLTFLQEQKLAGIEYTILSEDNGALERERAPMLALAEAGVEIRHHLQFFQVDLAHKDTTQSSYALHHHKRCIDLVSECGGTHVIVHLCLGYKNKPELMDKDNAMKNMAALVEYANSKGVLVCLENLASGLVSTPGDFLDFLRHSGAAATVDIGHVSASPCVRNGLIRAEEYIEALAPYIVSAHVYDIELVNPETSKAWHKAPDRPEEFESRIKALLKASKCEWWLIELGDPAEISRTCGFLRALAG